MNSKTILKRTMPLIIALVIIIIIAVSCSLLAKDKKVPSMEKIDPDGIFLEAGNVVITNRQIYEDLKSQMGIGLLVDMLDKQLLKQLKNSDNKSYYDAVTDEEIKEAIEEDMFPKGRTGDEEQDAKTEEAWLKGMFLYGYTTEELREEYFRLNIARRKYVRDCLEKEYLDSLEDEDVEDLITEKNIEDYYKANYTESYWAIIVRYFTLDEAKAALSQLDIVVDKKEIDDKKTTDAWFNARTNEELDDNEVIKAFIDLYNNRNSHKAKGYPNANPNDNLILREGVHYSIVDGQIKLNTELLEEPKELPQENQNLLFYNNEDLKALHKDLADYIGDLTSYAAENSELLRTFSINPRKVGDHYYFVFKYQTVSSVKLEDVKDEIIEKLLDEKLDESRMITDKMAALRAEYRDDFLIYDPVLEDYYVRSYDSTHPKTKKASNHLVARFNGVDYSVDDLFIQLSRQYGPLSVIDFYNYEHLLYSDYNKIYEYKGKNVEGKVLDKEAWKDIENQVKVTKRNFSAGVYESLGYPRTYGWENFLKDYYIRNYGVMVRNEQDLKIHFLYQKVVEEFKNEVTKTKDLWDEVYAPQMEKTYEEYLSATGFHLLIHVQDKDGNPLDPEEWTDYQNELAKEFYDELLNELARKRPTKLRNYLEEELIELYDNTPHYVAHLPQVITSQPVYDPDNADWIIPDIDDYRFAKYKTAGLKIKFETLTITAGRMVEPFENAVREIWDKAEQNNDFNEDIIIYDKSFAQEYLVTEFGYHVYVNTKTTSRPTTTVDGETVTLTVPSLELVEKYEQEEEDDVNDTDSELTRAERRSTEQYFVPIRTEIKGKTYLQLQFMIRALENVETFKFTDREVNKENQVKTILEFYIDTYYDSLKYVTNPNAEE